MGCFDFTHEGRTVSNKDLIQSALELKNPVAKRNLSVDGYLGKTVVAMKAPALLGELLVPLLTGS